MTHFSMLLFLACSCYPSIFNKFPFEPCREEIIKMNANKLPWCVICFAFHASSVYTCSLGSFWIVSQQRMI